MDPFLVSKVASAAFFREVRDTKGRPRKIKGYEKNVLMCVAANMASDINLKTSFKDSALKVKGGNGYYSYRDKTEEVRLMELLSKRKTMTKAEIARQCSITFRRAMVIVDELERIGVLAHNHGDLGYEVREVLLSAVKP